MGMCVVHLPEDELFDLSASTEAGFENGKTYLMQIVRGKHTYFHPLISGAVQPANPKFGFSLDGGEWLECKQLEDEALWVYATADNTVLVLNEIV